MQAEVTISFLKVSVYWNRRRPVRSDRDDMADVMLKRTSRQMTASGFAGLFGLFAGICAVFAGCVGLSDWRDEIIQARWPVVSAVVERANVTASVRALKDGGRKTWELSTRVSFEANGEARSATLFSRTAYSEEDAEKLHSWAAHHRRGSHIDIRYDPSQPNRAVFSSPEPGFASDRTRSDLILFAFAAIASAGLLVLAKGLRAREARAAPAADDGQRGSLAFGSLFAATGLMLTSFALYGAVHADPFTADSLMAVPTGLMFVFAGILIGLPSQYAKWRSLLATLVVTCFALTFDWAAFGPGEHHFTGSIGGIGFIPGEMMGRTLFGIFAVILDVCAIAMWIGKFRQMFTLEDSAANQADSAV
jgi:hypothetical protein